MLAQVETAIGNGWQTVLLGYGPLGVFAVVALGFIIWYGPRLFEGHISFMKTCELTQSSLATNLSTLTESHMALEQKHDKTHRALGHIANAGKESTDCTEAQRHYERAIDELNR
jgi:hypothetical protein